MSGAVDEVEVRLSYWGRKARGRYDSLGYAERSVLGRMIDEGAGAGQVSDWASQHLPDDVVEVDGAVAKLPRRYRRAVKLHYLTDWPADVKAGILRTSRRRFYLLVSIGKEGVYDRLVARI